MAAGAHPASQAGAHPASQDAYAVLDSTLLLAGKKSSAGGRASTSSPAPWQTGAATFLDGLVLALESRLEVRLARWLGGWSGSG